MVDEREDEDETAEGAAQDPRPDEPVIDPPVEQ